MLIGVGTAALVGAGATTWRQMGSMEEYDATASAARVDLAERPELHDLIRCATLAASGHNSQPWQFRAAENRIDILPDFSRRTPVVDPDDHHLYLSLGCAAENLAIAAAARASPGELRFEPASGGAVIFEFAKGPRVDTPLLAAITRRQSTRSEYDGRSVASADLRTLAAAAATPGVEFLLITERARIDRVRDLVIAGNSAQMADAAFMGELKSWLRFNPRQAISKGDGLFSVTSGNPSLPTWLGRLMFDIAFNAKAENDKYARQMNSSSGVAIFLARQESHESWVQVGRAVQRFALQATVLGLKTAFVNQPVEVARFRPELAALAGLPGRRPDIVMRFGYARPTRFSPRRPVDAVLVHADREQAS